MGGLGPQGSLWWGPPHRCRCGEESWFSPVPWEWVRLVLLILRGSAELLLEWAVDVRYRVPFAWEASLSAVEARNGAVALSGNAVGSAVGTLCMVSRKVVRTSASRAHNHGCWARAFVALMSQAPAPLALVEG